MARFPSLRDWCTGTTPREASRDGLSAKRLSTRRTIRLRDCANPSREAYLSRTMRIGLFANLCLSLLRRRDIDRPAQWAPTRSDEFMAARAARHLIATHASWMYVGCQTVSTRSMPSPPMLLPATSARSRRSIADSIMTGRSSRWAGRPLPC